MKRVGVDAHVLTGKRQGTRTFLENVLRQVGEIDGRNTYVIYSFDPRITSRLFPYPNFVHCNIAVSHAIPRLAFYWEWARMRDRLDVLVTQYMGPLVYSGTQFVVVHDLLFESHPSLFPAAMRWRLKLGTRATVARSRRVFTVSRYTQHELETRYGVDSGRIALMRNGFAPPATPATHDSACAAALTPYVLCVGRLEPRKNIDLAIAATASLRQAGTRLVIVGAPDRTSATLMRAIAADPQIVHLDRVSDSRLSALYTHASAFVFPSRAEGFGLPVLEALGHGAPVVASCRTAIPEVGGPFARYFDPEAHDAVTVLAELTAAAVRAPRHSDDPALQAHLRSFDWRAAAAAFVDEVERL